MNGPIPPSSMTYKAEHRRARGAALDELTGLDQELGLS
jgi:hypothetical protein